MKLCSCFGALLCGGVAILSLNVGAQEDWAKLPAASATNAPPAKPARVVQVAQPPVAQPIPAGQPVQAVPMAQPQTAQIPQPVQAAPVTQPVQIAQPAQPVRIVQPPQVPDVAQPGLAAPVAQTAATAQPVQVAQPVQPTQFAQPVQTVQSVQPVPAAQPIQTIPTAQPVQAVQATQPIQYAQPVATTVEPTAVPQTVQATQPVQAVQAVQPVQAAQPVQVTAPVQAIPAAQPAQPIQTVQAVQPTAAVQQVQASQAAVPVQPTPAPQAAQTVQASQPVQPTPVAAPVQSTPTPQPVQATPAAQPVRSVQSVQPVLPVDAAPASTQTIAQSTPAVQAAQSSHRTRASQVEEPLSGAPPAELDVPVQAVQSTQAVPSVMSAPTTQAGQPVPTQANAQTAVTTQPAVAPQPAQAAATNTIPDAATLAAQLYQTNQFTQPALGAPQNSTSLPVVLAGQLTLDPADIIIYNAKVLTLDTNFTIAQSIAIRSNIVLGVGKNKDMAVYQGPLTRSIDARGRVVMPGLYDGFVQSYGAAVSELNGAMPVLDSIAAAQEYIRRQSTNRPPGSWIVLHDLFPTRLKEGRLPTKGELDAASTNNPVVWHLGSLAIVNSKALEASHIVKESVDPKGGLIVRDHKFKPNGVLRNTAIAMLRMPPQPPAPNTRQRREALKALYALYNQHGITSIAEQNATTNAIDVFRDLAASNELTVRINVSRTIDPGTNDLDGAIAMLESMTNAPTGKIAYGPTGAGDDWVRIGALNFYLDGDVTLANAFLRTPYGIGATYDIAEPAYRSVLKPEPHVMSDLCYEAATRGWQLSAYCSGDAALDFALNCYERIAFQTNIQDRRFAITHNDFQASQAWPRCTNLNVVANLQPTCLNLDGASLAKTLGEQRLTWFMPIKSWTDRGLVVGAGSDHRAGTNSFDSISPWNPWLGIWITVTRETESGTVLNPEERLSREQAIRLYTSNNAWNHFEDRKKGSLELGKYADLIMLDTDVLECPVDDIRATGVLLTMVNGRVVWESRNNWAISTVSAYRPPEPQ